MEKDYIFFAASGLTSTSANHVANLAKEYISNMQSELDHIEFLSKSAQLISSKDTIAISEGKDAEYVSSLELKLQGIAAAKSLIAWLREAIKAKDRLFKEIENMSVYDYMKIKGIECPENPISPTYITNDDVIATWNIKQRNEYYSLETIAAVYGEFIHKDNPYSVARNRLTLKMDNPNEIVGDGRDTIIYHYTPSVTREIVDSKFFEMQKTYREAQAQLNSYKHQIEIEIQKDTLQKDTEYDTAVRNYNAVLSEAQAGLAEYKSEALENLQKLKIVIPKDLEVIYEIINKLGKKD